MKCKVIIFYESHLDHYPTYTIIDLLPFFKTGTLTHCFEDPMDSTKQQFLSDLEKAKKWHQEGIQTTSFNSAYSQFIMDGRLSNEELNSYSPNQRKEIMEQIHYIATSSVANLNASLILVSEMDKYGVSFCTMDMSKGDRNILIRSSASPIKQIISRDHIMAENIHSHCQDGTVSVLVGAEHFNIATLLRQSGVNVKEYYITKTPPEEYREGYNRGDYCLRSDNKADPVCLNHKLNGLVIDLAYDPSVNPTISVLRDLLGVNLDSHHEDEGL